MQELIDWLRGLKFVAMGHEATFEEAREETLKALVGSGNRRVKVQIFGGTRDGYYWVVKRRK